MKLLHDASVKVLDIVYLKFEEIYSKLCMAATGENCIKDSRQNLSVLTNDLMLLAVSVIGAASYIVNQATSDMVSPCTYYSECQIPKIQKTMIGSCFNTQ